MADTFVCDRCGGTFDSGSEEEAMKEYLENFKPEEIDREGRGVVCDDCYKFVMAGIAVENPEALNESYFKRS